MSDIRKEAILAELNQRLKAAEEESKKPKFQFEDHCFEKQSEFFRGQGPRFRAACCSRRAGKCREENTLVKTPTGSVKIQDLKPGDDVYGYDNDGKVRICKVTQLHDQGIKEVVDLIWNNQIMATSTLDHRWLAHNTYQEKREVKRLKDFNSRDRIAEEYVPIPGGSKTVKEAYALGALLGDGCSRESGIVISSATKSIVEKVADSLQATSIAKRTGNFSWSIKGLSKSDESLSLYNLWCRDKYAHEKTFNLEEVRTWNRESQLEFIAGLIDTDGSVAKTKDGRLHIRLSMQAKTVIENCQMLILDLFQYKPIIKIDNRDKYKNGPVYELSISNNKFSKRILKELPLLSEQKKWNPSYEQLNERNTNPKYTGFKLSEPRKAQCYDITINNDSHLFLDANGLIGHNTVGIAADAIETCRNEPGVTCLYITITKQAARNIIWADVLQIIEAYNLECKIDNTRLTVTFPNRSKFVIEGAKDRTEIEKYRGWKLRKCYIDEAQSFRSYIEDLVNDVVTPALRDLKGELYITGTPGPVKAGYFYKVTHSDFWHNVGWTAFDNPHMHLPPEKDLNQTLTEERTMKGIAENDPSYQRETYGVWIEDLDSLVFKFNRDKNKYTTLPIFNEHGEKYTYDYIFGIDIGYNDSDAIAVLAYNYEEKKVFLVDEYVKAKQTISSLVSEIKRLQNHYNPVKMVMDAGALGKKIQEEILSRHGINLIAAEKTRKVEFIELLNDDLRTEKFKAFQGSVFEDDCMLVQWDKESKIRNPERPKISDTYHSDICDAVLYAWRECRHFLSEAVKKPFGKNSNEYMDELEAKEAERMEEKKTNPFYDFYDDDDDDYSDIF
jgi:hypothetical protein